MYSVYQPWDPLRVCLVGKCYSPEFFQFITNSKVRTVFEKIAEETEEDFQSLIKLLESFGVEVLRPNLTNDYKDFLHDPDGTGIQKILPPPMVPRDYSVMIGNKCFWKASNFYEKDKICTNPLWRSLPYPEDLMWGHVFDKIRNSGSELYNTVPWHDISFTGSTVTRIGKDLYVGTSAPNQDISEQISLIEKHLPEFRWYKLPTEGHNDGFFCPVAPGLIISIQQPMAYEKSFPGWEVVYAPQPRWSKIELFLRLKHKNRGKWWVPGQELNDEFTEFVESWLTHWVGYVEETVFDVNMLTIDRHNVVCLKYNQQVFDALKKHKITPHIVNFRHRHFWDGGLHCMTSDLHRDGQIHNYFPERDCE